MKKLQDNQTKILSVLLFIGIFLFWLQSQPLLKLPFDPWFHLSFIRRMYIENAHVNFVMWPGDIIPYQSNWHFIWANVFRVLNINDTFAWASIIHKFQSLLVFTSVFIFSFVVIKRLINRDNSLVALLSLISAIIWFIGTGTFSVGLQQSWLIWYSLTPQAMALSFFWLGSAVIVELFWGKFTKMRASILCVVLFLLAIFILLIHELEIVYLGGFLVLATILNVKRIYKSIGRKLILIVILAVPILFLLMSYISYRYGTLRIDRILSGINAQFEKGIFTVEDRNQSVLSEIILISLVIMGIILIMLILNSSRDKFFKEIALSVNKQLFILVAAITIIFFIIPITPYLSVVVGKLSDLSVVWRLRFAMPWSIFIPIGGYILLRFLSLNLNLEGMKTFLLSIGFVILGLFISRSWNHVLENNINSLQNSYNGSLGVQYSEEEMQVLKNELEGTSDTIYLVRGDLGYLSMAVFGKNVLQTRFEVYSPESDIVKKFISGDKLLIDDKLYELESIDFDLLIPLDKELEVLRGSIERP